MGTFGTGITQDDTVADIVGFVVEQLKAGATLEAASAKARVQFRELENDEDESPLLWLALATVQWKYGSIEEQVLEHVRADIKAERGMECWREDPNDFRRRRAVLSKFLAKIETSNPKPSPYPRIVVRKAPFVEGDCLSVRISDGRYTAALVLKVDNSTPEYGKNLVAGLDYLETEPPVIAVFEQRQWLAKRHPNWKGAPDLCWYLPVHFKQASKNITVVGNIRLRWRDPKDSSFHGGWNLLGEQIQYSRAHASEAEV